MQGAVGIPTRAAGYSPGVRTTRTVVEDHSRRRRAGDPEEDLCLNDATDVVVLLNEGTHHGHDGVRRMAEVLRHEGPDRFPIHDLVIEGRFALKRWSATGGHREEHDGADTFVVAGGLIRPQPILFGTEPS
jgi:hypothetical protein